MYSYRQRKDQNNQLLQIRADVEFGVLRKDCQNFGICKIHQFQSSHQPKKACACCRTIADITLSKDGWMEFSFLKDQMNKKVQEKYFATSVFKVEEDFQFPKELINQLNTSLRFVLKAKHYPIVETDEAYLISSK